MLRGKKKKIHNPAGLKAFADRLRFLRKQRGLTMQALADISDVDRTTIKRIELNRLTPTLDKVISISRALNMELRDLMDDPAILHSDKVGGKAE